MLKGANGKVANEAVKARLAQIRESLPPGVRIRPFYDQSEVIDRTLQTVRNNLLEGGLLVVAVLFLFLGNLRAALIVAAVIPLSMLIGFIGMAAFGISANLMSSRSERLRPDRRHFHRHDGELHAPAALEQGSAECRSLRRDSSRRS